MVILIHSNIFTFTPIKVITQLNIIMILGRATKRFYRFKIPLLSFLFIVIQITQQFPFRATMTISNAWFHPNSWLRCYNVLWLL
jgi:hypothetical protein